MFGFLSTILWHNVSLFFVFGFFQLRNEFFFETSKLLEEKKISVDDFLNRMIYNDEELTKNFSSFQSVDASDETEDFSESGYGNENDIQSVNIEQIDNEPLEICQSLSETNSGRSSPEEIRDATMCMYCEPAQKANLVTSCGHISCHGCWEKWIDAQNKLLDKSDEPIRTIRKKRKNPKCMYCSVPTTSTTRIFFPF